jgi:nucleoside-diphosphate-sugar epimerase
MTKVLLTGSRGFLGSSVAAAFATQPDLQITHLVRENSGGAENLLISDDAAGLRPAASERFDTLVHIASWVPRNSGQADSPDSVAGTVGFTARVLAELSPFSHVVYASSIDVRRPARNRRLSSRRGSCSASTSYPRTVAVPVPLSVCCGSAIYSGRGSTHTRSWCRR